MKKYTQLSPEQRYTIQCLLARGFTQSEIASVIGRHKSTISRELKRNVNKRGMHANIYDAKRAEAKTNVRHKTKRKHCRLEEWHLQYIRTKLRDQRWSPEYISKRGKLEYGDFVSHETIYQYIWMCKSSNRKVYKSDKDLHKYLRHHNRRRKRKHTKQNRGCIPNRISIDQRPQLVESRKRIGDYEVDLMMGANRKPGLIVLTDRKSIVTRLIKIETKNSKVIAKKIIEKMKNTKVHTLTFDNGLEFAAHEKIASALQVKTYFTRPYTSQDKGSVENRIGQIRRFFPKGMDMSNVHHNTIKSVERKLNNRPVRKFNYLTPLEMMNSIKKVALIT